MKLSELVGKIEEYNQLKKKLEFSSNELTKMQLTFYENDPRSKNLLYTKLDIDVQNDIVESIKTRLTKLDEDVNITGYSLTEIKG
jgi:hypothetical protein